MSMILFLPHSFQPFFKWRYSKLRNIEGMNLKSFVLLISKVIVIAMFKIQSHYWQKLAQIHGSIWNYMFNVKDSSSNYNSRYMKRWLKSIQYSMTYVIGSILDCKISSILHVSIFIRLELDFTIVYTIWESNLFVYSI